MALPEDNPVAIPPSPSWKTIVRNTAVILVALFVFLVALDLMISSLQHLGASAVETIIMATSNPFTGLLIGLLVTAIIQSSSATTSMVVALVASGSIGLESAIPIIMGANVGTTITSTIVSLGFITRKKEFRRAVTAGTYHDFFNILTVLILFPLEYYYGFLSGLSEYIANTFFNQPIGATTRISFLGGGLGSMINSLVAFIDNGFILIILSFALLFGSILFFRRVLSQILGLSSPEGGVQRFFFQSGIKSFGWGLAITAAIRSSTITTSLVVPLVAKKVIRLNQAVPFILGANIGTTITAFIAAMTNSNIAISIAISHFLFNTIGVIIFAFIPYVKTIPVNLAKGLGKLTIRYRLAGFVYILLTFFFIPFSLIYLNRSAQTVKELIYSHVDTSGTATQYKIVSTTFRNQQFSSWAYYGAQQKEPEQLIPVERRKNILMVNNELFEFNKVGSCRDGEDKDGQYRMCIVEVLQSFKVNETTDTDSVYVFRKIYSDKHSVDLMISAGDNLIVSKLTTKDGQKMSDQLKSISEK
jgi:solute carrier family 34 (sodium-dependent phosphate cotransporter)